MQNAYLFNLLKKSLYFAKLYTLSIPMTKQTYKDFLASNGEQRRQDFWYGSDLFHAQDISDKPKYYTLIEFPYPSGEGLHVGHPRSFTAMDIVSRKRRMEGYNVLYPIGFDAFGLPAENYALKTGVHPKITTEKNIANFTRQLKALGFSFDWSRVVDTTEPGYYKWTQWIFSQLFKHGLAYKKNVAINYCTKDKVALANEEVVNGKCERCGGDVIQKEKDQWMLRITDYADRLDRDLDLVDFWDKIKIQQRNWVGKSEGALVKFKTCLPTGKIQNPSVDRQDSKSETGDEYLSVFTTRIDTIFSGTFLVLAPEHPFLKDRAQDIENYDEVLAYQEKASKIAQEDRLADMYAKDGVEIKGISVINPATGEVMPIWIANFVLAQYGTGAVFADAHDQRDFDLAKKYNIPLKVSLKPESISPEQWQKISGLEECFTGEGVLVNSMQFDGLTSAEARPKIIDWLAEQGLATRKVNYKLRDWVFSRQRYWGEPIPLVHCPQCATKKQKVLLIHGFEGSGETNWLPWMKVELEKQGFEVFAPTMSTAKNPDLEQWLAELSDVAKNFGEDDIIVGHSLGAQAAMHLIKKMNTKIGHLFIVGNVPINPTKEQWEIFEKRWDDAKSDFAAVKKFESVLLDCAGVDQLVGSVSVVISRDDFIFGPEVDAFKSVIPAGWRYIVYDDQGHFSDQMEPELLELISRAKVTGWRLVPELPLALPEVDEFRPGADGESPLAALESWINVPCPHCGGPAQRETDTMPQWAGSSWYFLRYIDPQNADAFADPAKLQYWMTQNGERNHDGIDWYNGGMEHTTLHLLYSRFWHKFLYDINFVPTPEPYAKRTSQGMILGEGGVKMSKSLGNVVNPDEIVTEYGADTMRLYEMFMGPFDQAIPWDTKSIIGVRRFLEKVWQIIVTKPTTKSSSIDLENALQQAIKKVSENIEDLKFNTAISALMILTNTATDLEGVSQDFKEKLLILLSPFAPHIAEELWQQLGHTESISLAPWLVADESKIITTEITFAVQINGKVRGTITVAPETSEADIIATAQSEPNIAKYLDGKDIKKTIVVPDKLVSFVI